MTCERRHAGSPIGGGFLPLVLCAAALTAVPEVRARADSDGIDADVMAMQQAIVARLTGFATSAPESRSTIAERTETVGFLIGAIEALDLEPRRHDYRLPNANGLIDLLLPPYRGTNVFTVIEATTPTTETVIVGAHFDSERGSPGAVDNASGVALVLALASRLVQLEERHLDFLLVFFDQEEDGEVGSRAFVRYLERQPCIVHSVHITDTIGWDEDGDRAVELQSPGPFLEPHYLQAAAGLEIPLHRTRGRASDTWPFRDAGYRTAGVWEDLGHGDSTPHIHTPDDTYDTLNFPYLASATGLMFEVLRSLSEDAADRR